MENVIKAIGRVRTSNVMAGQGFTKYKCKICGVEDRYHNTNTPSLCKKCEKDILSEYLRGIRANGFNEVAMALRELTLENEKTIYEKKIIHYKDMGWAAPKKPPFLKEG